MKREMFFNKGKGAFNEFEAKMRLPTDKKCSLINVPGGENVPRFNPRSAFSLRHWHRLFMI
ncbi:MAG: hypothetical protein Q8S21_02045 [Candidatus Paracaedibacteraceae bacterium]|nr:hypothetical protein [Candidatus Paracaedibacteraceae bacterium]